MSEETEQVDEVPDDIRTVTSYEKIVEEQMNITKTNIDDKLMKLPAWTAEWIGKLYRHRHNMEILEEKSIRFQADAMALMEHDPSGKYSSWSKAQMEKSILASASFKRIKQSMRKEKRLVEYLTELLSVYKYQFGKSLHGLIENRKMDEM